MARAYLQFVLIALGVALLSCGDDRGRTDGTMTVDSGPATGTDTGPRPDGTVDIGNCIPTCSSAQRCCGDVCVNRMIANGVDGTMDSSFMNCGACGNECDSETASACGVPLGMSGPPQCLCGNSSACSGSEACIMDGANFVCADLMTSEMHCGEPGNECADGEMCAMGSCGCGTTGEPCEEGTECCDGACIDVSSDTDNCGGCGIACGMHAPQCDGGECTCAAAGRACVAPGGSMMSMPDGGGLGLDGGLPFPPIGDVELGESCCDMGCVANDDTHCGCDVECDVDNDEECSVGGTGGIFGGGGEPRVCCADNPIPFFDPCDEGGGGFPFGDGGLGFGDGGLPFP